MLSALPFPLGSLVGRELDLAKLDALLAGGARLVTLTGLGGVGKTRLAIAVARRIAERGLATAYCDVAAVEGVTELTLALAQALAVELDGSRSEAFSPGFAILAKAFASEREGSRSEASANQTQGPNTLMSALAAALARREPAPLLVVIDNFERLVGIAGEAAVVGLRSCLERVPWLSALVTSRIALPRSAGITVVVHPIAAQGPRSAAVLLLAERAAQVAALPSWQSDGAALERLATRLEGLPLAIELAAARAHLVAPGELLALIEEHFEDAAASATRPVVGSKPGRAVTATSEMERLRDAVVAWSWGVLSEAQREALRRLEVVDGTFDLDLAAALIQGTRAVALETLEALVRVSLVMVEASANAARYRMLETVREFVRVRTPSGRDAAHDDLAEALLARLPPEDELTLFARFDATFVLAEREGFLAVLRRGLAPDSSLRSAQLALRAATWLLLALRRSGFAPALGERVETLLERADIEAVPLPIRLAASMLTVVVRVSDARTNEVDVLVDRVERWAATAPTDRPRLVALQLRCMVAQYRWNYVEVHRISQLLVASPVIRAELRLYHGAIQLYFAGRRALGETDFAADDALAAEVVARLTAAGEVLNALFLQCNRAFLAVHLGHPELAIALSHEVERAVDASGFTRLGGLTRRERARAELDLGLRTRALTTFDAALALLAGSREGVEGLLDRTAAALEAGRYEEARRDLAAGAPMLSTSFELGYHAALECALTALVGEPAPARALVFTGTVEDTAFRLLAALGSLAARTAAIDPQVPSLREAAWAHGPCSFRVRHALRLFEAALALSQGDAKVIGVDIEAPAFRLGAQWVPLDKRPLLATLFDALAQARLGGERGVDRMSLAALAWPGENVRRESLERRLETAMSALRKLGLQAIVAVGAHDESEAGYALDPSRAVLRVKMGAWPSLVPPAPARGRGRPRSK